MTSATLIGHWMDLTPALHLRCDNSGVRHQLSGPAVYLSKLVNWQWHCCMRQVVQLDDVPRVLSLRIPGKRRCIRGKHGIQMILRASDVM